MKFSTLIPILSVLGSCTAMHIHAQPGEAYLHSIQAARAAAELTDQEIEDLKNAPGGAISDAEWCGENPNSVPTNEEEWENLHSMYNEKSQCYLANLVWEYADDGDVIIILDDDGEPWVDSHAKV